MPDEKEQYKKSGMHESLSKPFTSQELWHCLMRYLTPVSKKTRDNQIESELEFQKELRLHFLKNNQGRFDEIENALEEGDIELARRLSHNLKANAAQIGKPLLQSAAADVERMLKDGKNSVSEELMAALKYELAVVLEELTSVYENAHVQSRAQRAFPAREDIDMEELRETFDKLESLLISGNPEVLHFSEKLREIPGGRLLVQQMEDFEFKFAYFTLVELKKELGLI
jgi:HPt (histidine-containing phosphotransfer) domain-containing protein